MLIVQTLGAPNPARRSRRRRRKAEPVEPPASPETVPVTRVTVARSTPFEGESEARAWLEGISNDPKRRATAARDELALLNRALDALRRAAEDPLVHEVGISEALAVRIGYGSGDELADGHWTAARQLPDPPPPRHLELDPQKAVADELAGREPEDAGRESEDAAS